MKNLLYIFLGLILILACDNKSKNKTLPINIEINRDFEENLIKKQEVKINIPINWEVLAESDKNLLLNSLFENSQYKGKIDYILTLSNSGKKFLISS